MKWAELLQIRTNQQTVTTSPCCATTTGCRSESPTTYRWTRWSARAARRQRRHLCERRHELLPERDRYALKVAENVAQVFMGMRIQCAQCHNHPFDRWTTDDYYSFAAFFAQIGRKPAKTRASWWSSTAARRDAAPRRERVMPPKFLGGPDPT